MILPTGLSAISGLPEIMSYVPVRSFKFSKTFSCSGSNGGVLVIGSLDEMERNSTEVK